MKKTSTRDSSATAGPPPDAAAAWSRPRWHGVVVFLLRLSIVGFFLAMCVQVVLGSMFASGDVQLLATHQENANSFLSGFLFLAFPLAILLWRPLRGPAGPLWWVFGLILVTEAVKVVGFARLVGWHIATGVLSFGLATLLVAWALRYRHRPRMRQSPARSAIGGAAEAGGPA